MFLYDLDWFLLLLRFLINLVVGAFTPDYNYYEAAQHASTDRYDFNTANSDVILESDWNNCCM